MYACNRKEMPKVPVCWIVRAVPTVIVGEVLRVAPVLAYDHQLRSDIALP